MNKKIKLTSKIHFPWGVMKFAGSASKIIKFVDLRTLNLNRIPQFTNMTSGVKNCSGNRQKKSFRYFDNSRLSHHISTVISQLTFDVSHFHFAWVLCWKSIWCEHLDIPKQNCLRISEIFIWIYPFNIFSTSNMRDKRWKNVMKFDCIAKTGDYLLSPCNIV